MGPRLLLLNELLGGLTFSEAEEVTEVIRQTNGNDTTVVLVEHRLKETFRVVGRVVVMNQGKDHLRRLTGERLEVGGGREGVHGR
jgi:branched-chain amino acid transport system ATP-binding protein